MLSNELRNLRSMVDAATDEDGELHLSAMQTRLAKLAILDLMKRAIDLERCHGAGSSRGTEAETQPDVR